MQQRWHLVELRRPRVGRVVLPLLCQAEACKFRGPAVLWPMQGRHLAACCHICHSRALVQVAGGSCMAKHTTCQSTSIPLTVGLHITNTHTPPVCKAAGAALQCCMAWCHAEVTYMTRQRLGLTMYLAAANYHAACCAQKQHPPAPTNRTCDSRLQRVRGCSIGDKYGQVPLAACLTVPDHLQAVCQHGPNCNQECYPASPALSGAARPAAVLL